MARGETAVVRLHRHVKPLTHVVDKERDVAERMVFTLARCAEDVDAAEALPSSVTHRFGEVVRLLFGIVDDGTPALPGSDARV